ncbi:MAG: hypothetical protein PVF82_10150 [Gammaproteobacteria bacterium]
MPYRYSATISLMMFLLSCDSKEQTEVEIPKEGTLERIRYDIERSQPDPISLEALTGTWEIILHSEHFEKYSDLRLLTNLAVPNKIIVKKINGIVKIKYTDILENEYAVGNEYAITNNTIKFKTRGKDDTNIELKEVENSIEKYKNNLRGIINFRKGVYVEWIAKKID